MSGNNEQFLRELGLQRLVELEAKAIGAMPLSALIELIANALKAERRRNDEKLDHLRRQVTLLFAQERGRQHRELVRQTEADDD